MCRREWHRDVQRGFWRVEPERNLAPVFARRCCVCGRRCRAFFLEHNRDGSGALADAHAERIAHPLADANTDAVANSIARIVFWRTDHIQRRQ